VGSHRFRAEVPNSSCCQILTKRDDIKPDNGTDEPQMVTLSLSFNDASISAPGAPQGAELRCPMLRGVEGPAFRVFQVPMTALEQQVSCDLDAPGVSTRSTSITLRAGKLTPVPWSAP
jgi:hypothetical protein